MIKNARILLLVGSLFMMLLNNKGPLARQSSVDPAEIDEFITRQITTQRVPGLALAITQGDRVLYVEGMERGNWSHHRLSSSLLL